MKEPTAIVVSQGVVQMRASEVRTKLLSIKDQAESDFFDMGDLLREAQEGAYAEMWGYNTFSAWIEQGSGLDLSTRQAHYLIRLSKTASVLGLTRTQLRKVKISSLKEIMSLDVTEFAEQIRELIDVAPTLSLAEVKARVQALKGLEGVVYFTLKLEKDVKEVVDEALELARKNAGSDVVDGEVKDISDSRCVELICAEYLTNPNNQGEEEQDEQP